MNPDTKIQLGYSMKTRLWYHWFFETPDAVTACGRRLRHYDVWEFRDPAKALSYIDCNICRKRFLERYPIKPTKGKD